MENEKCVSCEEILGEESSVGSLSQKPLCGTCYDSDCEYASTLIRFPDSINAPIERVIFGEHTCYSGTIDELNDNEPPSWFEALYDDWNGRVWSGTGYRGFYDTVKGFKNVAEVADGWVTSWVDDSTSRKLDTAEFLENLKQREILPPATLFVLFEPTSNVFSTATTFFCKNGSELKLEEWIKSQVDLNYSLS